MTGNPKRMIDIIQPSNPHSPSRTEAWILATRPKTLPAAVGPVLVGSALAFADGRFDLLPALVALGVALLVQVGVNLANDYFDYQRGIDTKERLGPMRVTQSGLISPWKVFVAMAGTLGLAGLLGGYLAVKGGWPVVVAAAAAILSALAYSAGPYPLASNGLGDLFVFIFFGPVAVCGTYYVQAHTLSPFVLPASIPSGLLITAILVVNNLRDIPTDRKTGKITLAVRMGVHNSVNFYAFLVAAAYPVLFVFPPAGYGYLTLLPFASLPMAIYWMRFIRREIGRNLNRALAGTAMLSLVFGILFSLGFLL